MDGRVVGQLFAADENNRRWRSRSPPRFLRSNQRLELLLIAHHQLILRQDVLLARAEQLRRDGQQFDQDKARIIEELNHYGLY